MKQRPLYLSKKVKNAMYYTMGDHAILSSTFRLSSKLSFERAEVDSGCFLLLVCLSAGHSSDFVPWDIF